MQKGIKMNKRFFKKEKDLLRKVFEEFTATVWAHGDTATVHMFGGHYYIKKVDGGYKYKWNDAIRNWQDNSPLTFVEKLEQIRG